MTAIDSGSDQLASDPRPPLTTIATSAFGCLTSNISVWQLSNNALNWPIVLISRAQAAIVLKRPSDVGVRPSFRPTPALNQAQFSISIKNYAADAPDWREC